MKINYAFANESVEVDVDEAWGEMLMDMDRREYNNNQTETRRHVSLHEVDQEENCLPADYSLEDEILQKEEMKELVEALEILSPEQLKLVRAIYFEGKSVNSVSAELGIDHSAVSHRLRTIRKKLEKVLI